MQAWIAGFTGANPDATVNYDPVGSGAGRTQFIAGGVAFAGSDAYLKQDELTQAQGRCKSDVVEVPAYVSPIAVVYNLQGVTDLQLAPGTIANIFNGTITTWNDPAIAADNPGKSLPDQRITPVHRSDESGTTQNFTDYLKKASGGAWTYDASGNWPVQGGEAAQGTSGVIGAIQKGDGTIGYADESQAGSLGKVLVKVGERVHRADRRRPLRPCWTTPSASRDAATAASPSTSSATRRRRAPTRSCWCRTRSPARSTPTRRRPTW